MRVRFAPDASIQRTPGRTGPWKILAEDATSSLTALAVVKHTCLGVFIPKDVKQNGIKMVTECKARSVKTTW